MAYPRAGEVVSIVRALLLSDAMGAEHVYTDTRIIESIGIAWRELWDALILFGAGRPRTTFYHLLPAYTNILYPMNAGIVGFTDPLKVEEADVKLQFDITSVTSGPSPFIKITTSAAHNISAIINAVVVAADDDANGEWFVTPLTETELVLNGSFWDGSYVSTGKEQLVVYSDNFSELNPVFQWTRKPIASTLGEYLWEMDRFRFQGATVDRLLSVYGDLSAPPAPTGEDDILEVDNSHNFLAYRTASLLAAAQGRQDLFASYSAMAVGPSQRPDGSGGFLAGLTSTASKALQRMQTQRTV
jgi:hypothetical protein